MNRDKVPFDTGLYDRAQFLLKIVKEIDKRYLYYDISHLCTDIEINLCDIDTIYGRNTVIDDCNRLESLLRGEYRFVTMESPTGYHWLLTR
jgi:hypothetical protein